MRWKTSIRNIAGMVSEVNILSTTIMTWDGIKVHIPISQLFNSDFRNYSALRVGSLALRFKYRIQPV